MQKPVTQKEIHREFIFYAIQPTLIFQTILGRRQN